MAKHKDSRGVYRALRVATDASDDEIRLSYALIKQNFEQGSRDPRWLAAQRAYDTLRVPGRRREYDQQQLRGRRGLKININFKKVNLDNPKLLAACCGILMAIFVLVWYPLYGARFRSFSPGDRLVDLKGRDFGVVVQAEEMHSFPGGPSGPGYLVERNDTRALQWYPALDLQGSCRKAD